MILGCSSESDLTTANKIRVLLDTDANNELDDQHAIAYLLFNRDVFQVEGLTVNRTWNGGDVSKHAEEAERIVRLCGLYPEITVYTGANGSFEEIGDRVGESDFDGAEAVDLIIERAHMDDERVLVLLPVGKLTNIALALKKDPSIIPNIRVVWLGSNYPDPGEYNQENDEPALSYILNTDVDFEIALVRYDEASGTDAVRVTLAEIRERMPGKGPRIVESVLGRHGGEFFTFGDYSVDLFDHVGLQNETASRALFDMAAVAIVKNPDWASQRTIPAPTLIDGTWVERPENARTITLWENFDRDAIIEDFFDALSGYD
jgi:inosine-uridine nucleoside N-ribohydrolase